MAGASGAWERVWCVTAMILAIEVRVRQKLQLARWGAREVVSGSSWLGFSRDFLFCHSMPLL